MAAPSDLDMEQAILDSEERQEKERLKNSNFIQRNLLSIPCFRESFMYGMLSGLGAGLGTFMLTSRVRRACDVAVGSYAAVTFCWWIYCRYERARLHQELQKVQYMVFDDASPPAVESGIIVQPKGRSRAAS
ncbi:cytochrome c oxidase assembly protein COX20, mitochondrial-like [Paramacrobiotus metropolitanus]|uniref:cytochrome c oxidase assembly protein COX20, mitochondrial-like n=1 Tax=Paramacrobiotus metropolitanus TaxID=2943436 RepID=UPI002445E121|nr:cytochrome c oxidase assembly protein COX20, mitochondrial-like [Paramacrobiotus metropolitanus]